MANGDRLLRTIEAVHAAALDEALWPPALSSIAHLFGARAATLEEFGKRPVALRYLKTAGVPTHGETAYLEYYARNNSRAQYAFKNLSKRFLCDYEFTDERTMDRDPYYAKYLTSLELRYFLSGQIANTEDSQAIVSIQRTRREGHVQRVDIERMQALLPHLGQAFDVSTRLRSTLGHARMLEQALGLLSDGVALVKRDGRIVFANEAFQAIGRRGDGVRVVRGMVEFSAADARSRFAQSLDANGRLAGGDGRAATAADFLVARTGGAPAYVVSLRLLADPRQNAVAILFIRDPLNHNGSAIPMLSQLFGFTEAEAGLAQALQAGMSPVAYAQAHKLSMNTVYTHLRRIRDKTSSRRLSELIRKLNDLQVPLR